MKKAFLIIILLLTNILISFLVYSFVLKNKGFVSFISKPREENESYGFFSVDGNDYFQVYTTTQVDIGNGLHYHRIDVRGNPAGK